jgi:uncharacterized membrane protein YtjA (UPF0391 family)
MTLLRKRLHQLGMRQAVEVRPSVRFYKGDRKDAQSQRGNRIAVTGTWQTQKERPMLYWSITFFIVAIIAGVFGFFGIASAAAGIAKVLFFLFAVLFVFTLITGLRGRGGPTV